MVVVAEKTKKAKGFFFGSSDFQIIFPKKNRHQSSKIQNPARGQKALLEGTWVDLNFRGVHKKSKEQRVYTP